MTPEHTICVRAGIAAFEGDKILLVPHYDTDAGPAQWTIPGGLLFAGCVVGGEIAPKKALGVQERNG